MKKIAAILLIILAGVFIYKVLQQKNTDSKLSEDITQSGDNPESANTSQSVSVEYENIEYIVYFEKVSDKTIEVIPNFQEKKSASSISEKNNCTVTSSGGFYTEDDRPLGLFKVNGEILQREKTKSNLVNGFFYIDETGDSKIGKSYPDNAPTIIQSGPLISGSTPLSTINDKQARRVVAIETDDNQMILAAVVTKGLPTAGPFLSDLGPILYSIHKPFQAEKVLNLDGGAASYFQSESGFELPELTSVGSIICIK